EGPGPIILHLPPVFEEVICQLLEKDPGARPGDAGVLARRLDSIRKKLTRQKGDTVVSVSDRTPLPPREGAATVGHRAVREELERLNRPWPIGRFVNKPIVLVVLFVL